MVHCVVFVRIGGMDCESIYGEDIIKMFSLPNRARDLLFPKMWYNVSRRGLQNKVDYVVRSVEVTAMFYTYVHSER